VTISLVFPGDDGASKPICYQPKSLLIIGRITDINPTRGPKSVPPGVDTLSIDVNSADGAVSMIFPGDDGATRAICYDIRVNLETAFGTDGYSVGGPQDISPGVNSLRVDIILRVAKSKIFPCNNSPSEPVRHQLRLILIACRIADDDPIGGPLRISPGIDTLGINVIAAAAAVSVIHPDNCIAIYCRETNT